MTDSKRQPGSYRPPVLIMGDTLNIGGSERQFVEVVCRLSRSKYEVHAGCILAEGPLAAHLKAARVSISSFGRGSFKSPLFLAAVFGLRRYLRVHRIQLVHTFDFYSNVLGLIAARLAGTGAVIGSRRDMGNWGPQLQRKVQSVTLRFMDRVMVNSGAIQKELIRRGTVAAEKIVVMENGVDVNRFRPGGLTKTQGEAATVGTIANLHRIKGIVDLIHSARTVLQHLPHTRFFVWGEGPLRTELEALVRELGLRDVLKLPGHTQHPEEALRLLDVFVLPSRSEGSSNALLEAMATGVPVVATRVGGNPFIVEDGESGLLVPPAEPARIASAIIRLLRDPRLALKLSRAGREQILRRFSIDQMVRRIETLYDLMLAGRKEPATGKW